MIGALMSSPTNEMAMTRGQVRRSAERSTGVGEATYRWHEPCRVIRGERVERKSIGLAAPILEIDVSRKESEVARF